MFGWMAAATIGSALLGSRSASKAASTQAAATESAAQQSTEAANRAADLQYQQFRESVELSRPYREAGELALNRLIPEATQYTPFGMAQFQADPGYGFRLSEGQKALERSAAARGNLLSGATGKALTRYGQEMGSQEYQNAFNRYQAERTARLQPLQSLAGVGQTTAQQLGTAGQNMASSIGNIYTGNAANVGNLIAAGGQARASGYMGTANAIGGGLNQYLNYSQNQAQNQLLQQALNSRRYDPANFAYTSY
jgi:hypothetical protein